MLSIKYVYTKKNYQLDQSSNCCQSQILQPTIFLIFFRESYNLISVINLFQLDIVDGKNEFLNLLVLQKGILSMPTSEFRVCLDPLFGKRA